MRKVIRKAPSVSKHLLKPLIASLVMGRGGLRRLEADGRGDGQQLDSMRSAYCVGNGCYVIWS